MSIDSTLWVGILNNREKFIEHMKCDPHYNFQWNGLGSNFSFKNAVETIRPRKAKDNLAEGIWCSRIRKHSMTLWRARWSRITTHYDAA